MGTCLGHGHLDMAWAHSSVWGKAHWCTKPGQLVSACCLVQKAFIKDTLVGTRSQEAPYGEGDNLLGEGSSVA